MGVRINRVRTMSNGRRNRPVKEDEMAMTIKDPKGLGLSERSIPEKPAARGVVRAGERPE